MKVALGLLGLAFVLAPATTAKADGEISVERGAYIAATSGCHDCHTGGFAESGGVVHPPAALSGVPVGFRGPWGTTYPVNVRLYMSGLSEEGWVAAAREMRTRPPMPWFALNMMVESELRSLYRYTRSLGDVGVAMPAPLPPDEVPPTLVIDFVPRDPSS